MDSPSLKNEIRKRIKAERKLLSSSAVKEKSQAIFDLWSANFELQDLKYLHLFISMEKFNEPDTSVFIEYLMRNRPDLKLVIPITDLVNNRLKHQILQADLKFEKNRWGLLEPVIETEWVAPKSIDLVLVPMLAFGPNGHRIGFGKGFYDGFLAQTRPDCQKVGLCFEIGRLENPVPINKYDISLDAVITENEVVLF